MYNSLIHFWIFSDRMRAFGLCGMAEEQRIYTDVRDYLLTGPMVDILELSRL